MKNNFILLKNNVGEIHETNEEFIEINKMYELIDCDRVDVVSLTDDIDLWVDDEGLMKSGNYVNEITFKGVKYTLAGNILILQNDNDGNSVGLSEDNMKEIMDNLKVRFKGITN